MSLGRLSGEAAISYDIEISKQGLDSRFDDKAVCYVKRILEEVIANQIGEPLEPCFLSKFSRVRIKDGTRFDLPQRLREYFPGYGGKITSEAAACVQYEFDLKNRSLLDLDVTSAKRTDYQDAQEKVGQIEKGDLVIRDLGYFSTTVLRSIAEKEAFFLTRLKAKMTVFDEDSREVNFSRLYSRMVKSKMPCVHIKAFIGEKERLPVRMSIELVPE
ncbi:MAG: transposase, partial [Methanococcaceae archaeon]